MTFLFEGESGGLDPFFVNFLDPPLVAVVVLFLSILRVSSVF